MLLLFITMHQQDSQMVSNLDLVLKLESVHKNLHARGPMGLKALTSSKYFIMVKVKFVNNETRKRRVAHCYPFFDVKYLLHIAH